MLINSILYNTSATKTVLSATETVLSATETSPICYWNRQVAATKTVLSATKTVRNYGIPKAKKTVSVAARRGCNQALASASATTFAFFRTLEADKISPDGRRYADAHD